MHENKCSSASVFLTKKGFAKQEKKKSKHFLEKRSIQHSLSNYNNIYTTLTS